MTKEGRKVAKCELIRVFTEDDIRLTGTLFSDERSSRGCVIHVHGSCGNFYELELLHHLASHYVDAGYAFMTFNLRSHDCISEGYRRDLEFRYIGGSLEPFETCVGDIQSAINFVTERGMRVAALQGHSLGCDRIVHFSLVKGVSYPLILLSPCDSYDLQRRFLRGRRVEDQIQELRAMAAAGNPRLLFEGHYGVIHGEENYYTPIAPDTLLSIMTGAPYRLFRYDNAPTWTLPTRAMVVVGTADSLLTFDTKSVGNFFSLAFGKSTLESFAGSEHDFAGFETDVSNACVRWVSSDAAA